jgi:hypothetical protein
VGSAADTILATRTNEKTAKARISGFMLDLIFRRPCHVERSAATKCEHEARLSNISDLAL